MSCVMEWPEPIVRVQSLSESGIREIPRRYVKPLSDRPLSPTSPPLSPQPHPDIPVVDLGALLEPGRRRQKALDRISAACREWGFFQVVNHGVGPETMHRARRVWREFFGLPAGEKAAYANSPATYEGYGSRLGVEKGAVLDWSDYFFLSYLPAETRDPRKWPEIPNSLRETVEGYCKELTELCKTLMKILSINLGLEEGHLPMAFGGEDVGASLRANFYPKCPQPDLTLGLSPHSDPGGITVLLPDTDVSGLQVRKGDDWITVKPIQDAFIVNIGDQIQVLSNGIYKSVEHRVTVNAAKERLSLAFFYNPRGDVAIEPMKELVGPTRPALYQPMTFNQYRTFIRTKGPCGKSQVESLKSPPP